MQNVQHKAAYGHCKHVTYPFCNRQFSSVARQLGVEASLVIRVALGERQSRVIEEGLKRELQAIAYRVRKERLA